MAFFKLSDMVFLVEGACSHAIYDLNCRKLYSINDFTLSFIRDCISKNVNINSLSVNDKRCLDFLLTHSIVEPSSELIQEKKIENRLSCFDKFVEYAWIEVTNLCNLRCKHCYSFGNSDRQGSMSINSLCYLISELKSIGVKRIQIIGGEPLVLNEKLKKIISMVSNEFEEVSIYTNATRIDKKWALFFKEHEIKINTTVFSYSAQVHDKVTNMQGSHKRTNKAIRYLNEVGAEYSVSCVRMDGVELGIKETDLYDLNERRDIVRICGRASFKLLNHNLLREKVITKEYFSRPLRPEITFKLVSGHNCFSHKIYISHDLNIFPCVMERGIKYGSLKEKKLKQIIKKSPTISKNYIKACQDCEYRYACFDCRPDRIKNDILAKPWYCSYDPYNSSWHPVDDFINSLEQNYLN